jgi:hypothetical protein
MEQIKDIKASRLATLEEVALEDSVKQIRAFFIYRGSDSGYFQRARVGAAVISSFARIRASETNRMALEMAGERSLRGARELPESPTP